MKIPEYPPNEGMPGRDFQVADRWNRLMDLLPDGWDCDGAPEAAIAADLAELPRVQEQRNRLEERLQAITERCRQSDWIVCAEVLRLAGASNGD